ncbi:MAG: hypothetical protein J5612_05940 [Paludibacteraceae bacterium]|nr:hypothetical protein [Paludibacteraceae bacterium]
MAKVNWSAGIDSVSGALAKPGKNPQHRCSHMLLANHRVAATTNPNCNRLFIRKPIERSTPLTSRELDVRERFTAVRLAVRNRMVDPTKITADQIAFKNQKDDANGKKTMLSYLWKLEGETYDAAHPRG